MVDLFGNEKMLALSWKQPFASAMLFGKIETRIWHTAYRGKVLICSSKQAYDENTVRKICGEQFIRMCKILCHDKTTLHLNGYAIAIGELINCRKMKKTDEEATFVRYHPDLYCHIYKNIQPIIPFQWQGTQGWKTVEQSIIDKIKII